MKLFIIAFAFVLCGLSAFAQNTVILQRGNEVIGQYTSFTQAVVTAAQGGDFIFITNSLSDATITIDKQLNIIGAGFWPNSTPNEPGYTQVNNPLVFGNGSNGSFVTGIRFTNTVKISGNTSISGITFDRCRFNTLYLAYGFESGFSSSIHIVRNSYIWELLGHYGGYSVVNALITNNIIRKVSSFSLMNIFANNIFTGFQAEYGEYLITSVYSCSFQNNIIFTSQYGGSYRFLNLSNSNVFTYNMFIGFTGSGGTNNIFTNSFNNVNKDSVFVNYTPLPAGSSFPYFNFSYDNDYHLLPNCVGVGAGSDGTDIGIYGGPTPWKEQAYPINPRITNFFVTPQVPANGIINVNATVEGQSR